MPLSRYSGLLYPTDLEILQRVLDRLCKERSLEPDSPEIERLAKRLFLLHGQGIGEEEDLLRAVAEPG